MLICANITDVPCLRGRADEPCAAAASRMIRMVMHQVPGVLVLTKSPWKWPPAGPAGQPARGGGQPACGVRAAAHLLLARPVGVLVRRRARRARHGGLPGGAGLELGLSEGDLYLNIGAPALQCASGRACDRARVSFSAAPAKSAEQGCALHGTPARQYGVEVCLRVHT